jgi:gas vesicle protein
MLRDMANRVRGVAIQFASGLAPAVTQAMRVFGEAVSTDGVSGIKKLGEAAGHVAKGIVAVFVVVGKFFGVLVADIIDGLTGIKDAASALLSGDFSGAWNRIKDSAGRSRETWKSFGTEVMDIMAELGSEAPKTMETAAKRTAAVLPQITEEQRKEAIAAAKARSEFQKAALENELKLLEARGKLMAERDKAAYEEGLLSLREYYARRRETALSEIDREISALEARKKIAAESLVDTEADRIKLAEDLAAIETQIDLKKIERLRTEEALAQEERQASRQLASERLQLDQKLLEAQGQRHDAALLGLDEELRKTEELLKKQGIAEAERAAILGRQRTTGEAGIEFERLKEQADAQFKHIESAQQDIHAQVQEGLIFELEGEEKIIAIEKERLPLLKEIASEMQAVAEATGDPEKIAQVKELNAAIRELEISTDLAGQRMAEFKKTVQDAMVNGLAQFFIDVTSGAKDVKDAFRDMVLSVIESIQQMLAQMLAMMAVKAMFGAFGFSTVGMSGGGQVKAATGGLIRGVGTGTSDSIPAWLSDGEFVVRAAVVKKPGVLDHLKELNRGMVQPSIRQAGGIRRFAEGGLVSAGNGKSSMESSLTVGLEQGLILKELSTPEGQRVLVRLLGQNKRAAKQALGG